MPTIRISTGLLIPGQQGDAFPYTPEVSTLSGLLRTLSERIGFDLVDGNGQVSADLDITINGKELSFCPSGLATPLRPDDRVSIHFIPLGGG